MNQDVKIAAAGLFSAVALLGLFVYLEWVGLDWEKWFKFAGWTILVFGFLVYRYGRDFGKGRCLLVFLAILALHVTVLVDYLRSATKFPSVFFLFFSPLEGGIAAFILVVAGGAHPPRIRRTRRPPEHRWPPRG